VGKEIARVAVLRPLGGNGETGKEGGGRRFAGNVGRGAGIQRDWCRRSRNKSSRGHGNEDGCLHGWTSLGDGEGCVGMYERCLALPCLFFLLAVT